MCFVDIAPILTLIFASVEQASVSLKAAVFELVWYSYIAGWIIETSNHPFQSSVSICDLEYNITDWMSMKKGFGH
jgi:hypothetical protein